MDISQENGDGWIAQAFGVPSVPKNSRDHYPFSRDTALVYRLKLAVVLLNAACAFFRMDDPCLRFSFILHCWLICVTCEAVYKNYPWREPLNVWMWRLRLAVPFWCLGVISTPCVVLLLFAWSHLYAGCEMPHPLLSMCVVWLYCMVSWPLVRERWSQKKSETDYDQFSAFRPSVLMFPGPLGKLLAALWSPSLLTLLTISAASWIVSRALPAWLADVWMASVVALTFAVLCCERLLDDVGSITAAWKKEESAYISRIENSLRTVIAILRKFGVLREGDVLFDHLSVQVPLLQREAKILLTTSQTLDKVKTKVLEDLITAPELLKFRETLDHFGPYTSECCVS